ncbi:MAG: rimL [Crocinitomicaceae bacterium]|jgi:RimJ/RimL family protein N-acetyltransferase|nr:rimL [Crocinitomicaceae bacterium]
MEVRLILLRDSAAFFDLIERNREYLRTSFPKTVAAVVDIASSQEYILQRVIQHEQQQAYLLVIEEGGQLIGMLGLKEIDWTFPKAEIAYFIDQAFQGKGIISQALKTLIEFSFGELQLQKIYARISPENPGSRKVVEKNGFVFERLVRDDFQNGDGKMVDVEYFTLFRT